MLTALTPCSLPIVGAKTNHGESFPGQLLLFRCDLGLLVLIAMLLLRSRSVTGYNGSIAPALD